MINYLAILLATKAAGSLIEMHWIRAELFGQFGDMAYAQGCGRSRPKIGGHS
jgi:hypothetical protein